MKPSSTTGRMPERQHHVVDPVDAGEVVHRLAVDLPVDAEVVAEDAVRPDRSRRPARRAPGAARRRRSAPIARPPVRSSLSRWLRCSEPTIGRHGRCSGRRRRRADLHGRRRAVGRAVACTPGTGVGQRPHRGDGGQRRDRVPVLAPRLAGGVRVRAVRHGEHVAAAVVDHLERARRRRRPGARRTRSRRAPGPSDTVTWPRPATRARPRWARAGRPRPARRARGPARRRRPSSRPSLRLRGDVADRHRPGPPSCGRCWRAGHVERLPGQQRPDPPARSRG